MSKETIFNVNTLCKKAGLETPYALHKESGLEYATCWKIWHNHQKRADLKTINTLCDVLNCEPGEIFIRVPKSRGKSKKAVGKKHTVKR